MKIWLDDERDPTSPGIQKNFGASGDEIWCRDISQAIKHLITGKVVSVSFDHDLGYGHSGYVLAKWVEKMAFHGKLPRFRWWVHSQSPIGRKNIIQALKNAERYWTQI